MPVQGRDDVLIGQRQKEFPARDVAQHFLPALFAAQLFEVHQQNARIYVHGPPVRPVLHAEKPFEKGGMDVGRRHEKIVLEGNIVQSGNIPLDDDVAVEIKHPVHAFGQVFRRKNPIIDLLGPTLFRRRPLQNVLAKGDRDKSGRARECTACMLPGPASVTSFVAI